MISQQIALTRAIRLFTDHRARVSIRWNRMALGPMAILSLVFAVGTVSSVAVDADPGLSIATPGVENRPLLEAPSGDPGPTMAPPQSVELVADDISGGPGELVSFDISLSAFLNVDSLSVFKLCLEVDPTVLDVVDVTLGVLLDGSPGIADENFGFSFEDGLLCISATNPQPIAIWDGVLFTVQALVGDLVRTGDIDELLFVDTAEHPLRILIHPGDEIGVKSSLDHGSFTGVNGVDCAQGDVDGDEAVTVADAVLSLRISVGLDPDASQEMRCAADANRDRVINTADTIWILRDVVGLPNGESMLAGASGLEMELGASAAEQIISLLSAAGITAGPRARLEQGPDGARLIIENASSLGGLDVDLSYDAFRLSLGDLPLAGRGLRIEGEMIRGLRQIRWAAPLEGVAASDGRVVLEFEASARGAEEPLSVVHITGYDAEGRPVPIQIESDRLLVAPARGPVAARAAKLLPNYPNPFNPSTTLSFELTRAAHVRLEIYDIRGARVRMLVNERRDAGAGTAIWNGTDESGRPVASGMYFARLVADELSDSRRLLLVK